jgi:site-specific recombinase XerD
MSTEVPKKSLDGPRVVELFNCYVNSQRVAKPSAAIRMTHAWKHLQPTFALIRPEAITDELCLQYCSDRRGACASIGTISNELAYLRAALNFAYRNRWIDTEPRILVPRRVPAKANRLTILQMRRLLAAASMPHLRLFIALIILTQSRPKDLLALKWTDVDLIRCLMEFRDAHGRVTAKKFNEVVRKWLVRAYEVSKSDFVIEWGAQQVVEIKRGFQMTAKRAGVICTPMALYRSAADLAAKTSPSIRSLGTLEDTLDSMAAQITSLSEDGFEVMNEVRKQAQRNDRDAS